MKCRLFNLLTALSLLPCLAATAMWWWSYWRWELWRLHPDPLTYYSLVYDSGRVGLLITTYETDPWDRTWWGRGWNWTRNGRSPLPVPVAARSAWERMGFYRYEPPAARRARFRERALVAPAWVPAVVTGALPAFRLVRRARARSGFAPGRCRRCGYDLRATPERCPECGHAPAGATP